VTPDEKRERDIARRKKWFAAHPGYATRKTREFREKNPSYFKEWAASHRENLRAADDRYRKKDPHAYRTKKRVQKKKWRENNPEKDALACAKWREKNGMFL